MVIKDYYFTEGDNAMVRCIFNISDESQGFFHIVGDIHADMKVLSVIEKICKLLVNNGLVSNSEFSIKKEKNSFYGGVKLTRMKANKANLRAPLINYIVIYKNSFQLIFDCPRLPLFYKFKLQELLKIESISIKRNSSNSLLNCAAKSIFLENAKKQLPVERMNCASLPEDLVGKLFGNEECLVDMPGFIKS